MPQDTLEQRAVLWTQALVRVPSVSGSPACLQVLETARDLIESTGVEADIRILFPEAPNPPAWKILGAPASRVTACTDAAQRT